MATFIKTPASKWKAVIRKQGWPTTSKTFRTKRDAEDWARRSEDEMARGVHIQRAPSERLTLKAALQRYLLEVSPTKSPGSQAAEKTHAKPLVDALGGYSLAAITADLVAQYRDARLATVSERTGRTITANTTRGELALLSGLFNTAIREWRLGLLYNPVANIRKPSPGKGRERRLMADEERRLLAAADSYSNPMMGWIVRLALHTGMRSGEITSLRRHQVDLEKRVVRLDKTKNGSARTVPLSRAATEVLHTALAHPIRPIDTDLVFFGEPGCNGKRRPYLFQPAWRRDVLPGAGIAGLRFHDLRHEAVSRLVESGMSDQEVAAISGHKTMQMLRRYTHLRAEDLVAKLDALAARA